MIERAGWRAVQQLSEHAGRGAVWEVRRGHSRGSLTTIPRAVRPADRPKVAAVVDRARALRGANLLALHDYGFDPSCWYVEELVPGAASLARVLARGPMSLVWVLEIGTQVAAALHALHAAGFARERLEPADVLLVGVPASPPSAYLSGGAVGAMSVHANIVGPGYATYQWYLPPEPEASVGAAGDVFALGAVLCWCLSFTPQGPRPVPPPIPSGPSRLVTLLRAMCAPAPQDRPRMPEVARALLDAGAPP